MHHRLKFHLNPLWRGRSIRMKFWCFSKLLFLTTIHLARYWSHWLIRCWLVSPTKPIIGLYMETFCAAGSTNCFSVPLTNWFNAFDDRPSEPVSATGSSTEQWLIQCHTITTTYWVNASCASTCFLGLVPSVRSTCCFIIIASLVERYVGLKFRI